MEKILSIILPVYNVEEYLERCIRNLEDQDIAKESYEIIVVNDGSPDNSREIVLRLMKEFGNIVFIEQENRGVSMARNAGIEKAIGSYLLFVDPDDYVLPNVFNSILDNANQSNCEVAYLGYQFLDVDGKVVVDIFNTHLKGKVYHGHETYFLARDKGFPDPDRSWSILFKRKFIVENSLYYLSQVPYLEDGEFIARVLCLAERCVFDAQPFYMRTTRPGSATNSSLFNQERAISGFIRAAENLMQFQRQCKEQSQRLFLNQPIVKFTLLTVQACVTKRSFYFFKKVKNQLREASLEKLQLDGCIPLYTRYGSLYNISPLLFSAYYAVKLVTKRILNS